MSDIQSDRPGEPGTQEGETGPTESDPVAPSGEGQNGEQAAEEPGS